MHKEPGRSADYSKRSIPAAQDKEALSSDINGKYKLVFVVGAQALVALTELDEFRLKP